MKHFKQGSSVLGFRMDGLTIVLNHIQSHFLHEKFTFQFGFGFVSVSVCVVGEGGGGGQIPPPFQIQSLKFSARRYLPIYLAPPSPGSAPPLGNPGSATRLVSAYTASARQTFV